MAILGIPLILKMDNQKEAKKYYTTSDLRVLADEYWIYLGGAYPKRNTAYHNFIDFIKDKNPRFSFLRLIIRRLRRFIKKEGNGKVY